ncbi:MAG: hypothetical protein JXA81_14730 [Sedimentisphaerales bacterium]|nr:hypothetical protein [Sedimentisphaerales bacterium]
MSLNTHHPEQPDYTSFSRRDFLTTLTSGLVLYGCSRAFGTSPVPEGLTLAPTRLGSLKSTDGVKLIDGAQWYVANAAGDGLEYTFAKGALVDIRFLTSNMLLDGEDLAVFNITLHEGADGPAFSLRYGLLCQCSARLRFPLSLVDMNLWRAEREGAWLKPQCDGQRVNLADVDRMTLKVIRKGNHPVRWCMTPLTAIKNDVAVMTDLVLPKGKLLDELGQSATRSWPQKSKSVEEVNRRIQSQLKDAPEQKWPGQFSKWGGWKNKQFTATGFFRTEYDGSRWWLVDPDGFAFWSAGVDCVRVDESANIKDLESALAWKPDRHGPYAPAYRSDTSLSYITVNMIRALGPDKWEQGWEQIALAQLRKIGFNTFGNWSEWDIASRAEFPYVRPLRFRPRQTKNIYRDFPDVFDPAFEKDSADYARQLADTTEDPALIGYFMMNEPTWAFSSELPAVGMLLNTPDCLSRKALADFLKQRYTTDAAFAAAWQTSATLENAAGGKWTRPLAGKATEDLEAFSEIMVKRLFDTLQEHCRKVDSKHLNLGIRYYTIPPKWAMEGMKTFDVFSMNFYRDKIPSDAVKKIHEELKMPVIIGEWHFGALDAGMPASGIGRVATQADRGKAYRIYLEDAAANPYCVGTHWFILYDQSALGRFDGENYNIGFFDVCSRPYEPLCDAARKSHEALYDIASGIQVPYSDAPQYLDKVFL